MIKSSYGCVRYARRVPHNNYTLLDLVVDFNKELNVVQDSINLALIKTNIDEIIIEFSARSMNNENLKELKNFDFFGVDVSSAVEKQKGVKDKQKMFDFVKAANEIS